MINPKELMVLNKVLHMNIEVEILTIVSDGCWTKGDQGMQVWVSFQNLYPIKLTPSILERCGFVKKILSDTNPDEGHYYSLNLSNDKNCDLAILSGDKTGEFDCYLFPYDMIRIKNLHTLMNLTKTLTGKELEIKK
jgi:hypothetical protein